MPVPNVHLVRALISLVLKIGIWYKGKKNRKDLEEGKPL